MANDNDDKEERDAAGRPLSPTLKVLREIARRPARENEERERRLDTELPEASTAWQTRRAGRLGTRYYNRHTRKNLDLWCTQLDVLAAIAAIHDGIITTVARKMDVAPSTLSRAVARLERRGLLRREIRDEDRRRRYLVLTDEGRALLERGVPLLLDVPQRRVRVALSQEHVVRVRNDSLAFAEFVRGQIRVERSHERDPSTLWEAEMRWAGATEQEIERERKARLAREVERHRRSHGSGSGPGPP